MNERIINAAIEEFNKYRKPEACVKLKKTDKRFFEVVFTGHFCYTCGFYDYFDDFLIILEEKGMKAEIKNVREIDGGAMVKIEVKEIKLKKSY